MFVQWKNIDYTIGNFRLKLNLNINRGELVTLLGPSGCGKTTALRIAAGFIKPDSGDFIINNQSLIDCSVPNRNIGIVFQNYALFPHLTVEENISYGLKGKKVPKGIIRDEVEFLLESLELKGYNSRNISNLSGGEKQRVALGRSLAIKPRLLLLDEPLSALDMDLRKKLRYKIKSIQQEFNISTLYVTHDQEEALAVSDRVALLKDGSLQQFSAPKELYNNPKNIFTGCFIGESTTIIRDNKTVFFRPEYVCSGHSQNSYNFTGKIVNNEYLGHYSRGILKCNNNERINILTTVGLNSGDYHVKKEHTIQF